MSITLLDDVEAIANEKSFAVTTSLLWDPVKSLNDSPPAALPLKYHQARLIASANTFKLHKLADRLSGESGIKYLVERITQDTAQLPPVSHKLTLKCRADGSIEVASSAAPPPLYSFLLSVEAPPSAAAVDAKIYLSPHTTHASPFTVHKTTHRPMYTAIRMAASVSSAPPTAEEVLLNNEHDQITEASLSTVYFWRAGRWTTPASACGGNLGASRMLALEHDWCVEGIIRRDDVQLNEVVVLSNGVRGFWYAVVRDLP